MKAIIGKVQKGGKEDKFFLGVQAGAGTVYYELKRRPKLKEEDIIKWSKEFNIPL